MHKDRAVLWARGTTRIKRRRLPNGVDFWVRWHDCNGYIASGIQKLRNIQDLFIYFYFILFFERNIQEIEVCLSTNILIS